MKTNLSKSATARFLGWFSIGLASVEILMPRSMARWLDNGSSRLWKLYGVRELLAGLRLLGARNKAPWLWARVAGNALDITTLTKGLVTSRCKHRVGIALGMVMAVTVIDVLCARAFSRPAPESI